MALPRMRVKVWHGDIENPFEAEVEVLHVDRLKAEVAWSQLTGGQEALALNMTTTWAWAALTREKRYEKPLAVFLEGDCLGVELDEEESGEVVPTPEEELTEPRSSSPSAIPGPRSDTGSAPTMS